MRIFSILTDEHRAVGMAAASMSQESIDEQHAHIGGLYDGI